DWHSLLTLWVSLNELILHLVRAVDSKSLGNTWNNGKESISLEALIVDYYRHMKWHEGQFSERVLDVKQGKQPAV
ncbi:MAG TPA: hypothetical protein VF857_00580, partial [Spirochaetota bacterium]